MLKKAKEDLSLLMRSGKHIFVFELTYKLAATAIVYPLAVLVLNLVFRFAGISYLTNEYIFKSGYKSGSDFDTGFINCSVCTILQL